MDHLVNPNMVALNALAGKLLAGAAAANPPGLVTNAFFCLISFGLIILGDDIVKGYVVCRGKSDIIHSKHRQIEWVREKTV